MGADDIVRQALDVIAAANTLTLPIDVERICVHFVHTASTYTDGRELLERLELTEDAARCRSLTARRSGKHYIFLSDELSAEERRQALAHEIGHIELQHLFNSEADWETLHSSFHVEQEQDVQAATFAVCLLAPPPMVDLFAPEDGEALRQLTGICAGDTAAAFSLLAAYRRQQWEYRRCMEIEARTRQMIEKPSASRRRAQRWHKRRASF